jgi:hypothetical protein
MGSANRTEDVLNVYNQLTQVREQIEVTKGQIQYYEQSAALSSISVELVPDASVQPLTIAGWEPGGVAKEALQALITGLKGVRLCRHLGCTVGPANVGGGLRAPGRDCFSGETVTETKQVESCPSDPTGLRKRDDYVQKPQVQFNMN